MEEKYFIINNADQYYVILKCNNQHLYAYKEFGRKVCLTSEGAIDLFKISEWLINRKIKHTVIFGKISNLFLRALIKKDLDIILPKAINEGLLIPNEEIENLLLMSIEKRSEKFWIT